MDPGARTRQRPWFVLVLLLALVLGPAAAASAQDGTPPTSAPPSSVVAPAVFGTLSDATSGPVAGANISVRLDGAAIGAATTAADGTWRVEVPGPGRYEVALDVGSLPDGVRLRDPAQATLTEVRVLEGRDKLVNFSLGAPPAAASGSTDRTFAERAANLTWSGLVVGLVIALSAVGLSLVFGATGLVNFAHGEMVTFGALIAWFVNAGVGGPQWSLFIAGAIAVVVSGAFGALQDRILWRPLERRRLDLISLMIVSIGLAMLIRYSMAVVFDTSPRPFRQFAAQPPWTWGPVVFPPKELAVVGLAVLVIVLYATVLQRTRFGTAVRALSDNRDLAESSGIDVGRIVLLVWVAGSALAGLGGVTYAALYGVQWDMGYRLLLPIFAAVVLGGLGTAYGALVGGIAIGLVSELSTLWFPAEFKFGWALAALILGLIVRPQGFLGRAERVG